MGGRGVGGGLQLFPLCSPCNFSDEHNSRSLIFNYKNAEIGIWFSLETGENVLNAKNKYNKFSSAHLQVSKSSKYSLINNNNLFISTDFSSGKATCTSRNPSAVSIDASNAVTMVTSSAQLCAPLTDPSSTSPCKGANMARTNQPVDTKSSGRSHLSTSVHVPVLANKRITTAKDYYKHDNVSMCSVASFVANETTVIATYSASPVAAIVSDTFTNTKTVLQSSMMNLSEFPLSKQKENILTSCSTNKMAYAQPYLYCDRRSIPAQYTSMPLYCLSALCCQVDSCSTPSAVSADQTAILNFNSQSQQCSPNLVTNQPQKYAPKSSNQPIPETHAKSSSQPITEIRAKSGKQPITEIHTKSGNQPITEIRAKSGNQPITEMLAKSGNQPNEITFLPRRVRKWTCQIHRLVNIRIMSSLT